MSKEKAYLRMTSALETRRANAIIVEAVKLGKLLYGNAAVFFGPFEHLRRIVDPRSLTERANHFFRVVQEVIRVQNSKVILIYYAIHQEKVKEADKLFVASLIGKEVREPISVAERWEAAAPVGGNRAAGVADEEREVKLL